MKIANKTDNFIGFFGSNSNENSELLYNKKKKIMKLPL